MTACSSALTCVQTLRLRLCDGEMLFCGLFVCFGLALYLAFSGL